jgi:hypothetical protein
MPDKSKKAAATPFPAKLRDAYGREFYVVEALHRAEKLAEQDGEELLALQLAAIYETIKPVAKLQ